jgi:hypothetical protein
MKPALPQMTAIVDAPDEEWDNVSGSAAEAAEVMLHIE